MEQFFGEPSARIARMKERFLNEKSYMCAERAVIYTDVYQELENFPVVVRRAEALKRTLEHLTLFVNEEELLVGNIASRPRSAEVFPEVRFASFINELDEFETREHNRLTVPEDVKKTLKKLFPYWKGKSISEQMSAMRPKELEDMIASFAISNPHEFNTFGHVVLDYGKLLKKASLAF